MMIPFSSPVLGIIYSGGGRSQSGVSRDWGLVESLSCRIGGLIFAAPKTITVLQHDSANVIKDRDPDYSACLAQFFGVKPLPGETILTDGKVLWGSYESISDDPKVDSHTAILLVNTYIVERGSILEPYEVESKTNEITALPSFIHQMAL